MCIQKEEHRYYDGYEDESHAVAMYPKGQGGILNVEDAKKHKYHYHFLCFLYIQMLFWNSNENFWMNLNIDTNSRRNFFSFIIPHATLGTHLPLHLKC